MLNNLKTDNCTMCGACVYVCAKNAIDFKTNISGVSFPDIDSNKCIDCGKCSDICEKINSKRENHPTKCYVAVHKDNEVIHKSASGGMTTALCKSIIEQGGVAYGAHFDSNSLSVKHIRIDNTDNISLIRKSKYAQSHISAELYRQIKNDLESGLPVLFTGTPCQSAAIRNLFDDPDNLFIADLICHGVIREKVFTDYLNYIQEKNKAKIINVDFRGECEGKVNFNFNITTEKAIISEFCGDNLLYRLFINSAALKYSCFECNFACNHSGDITIADFNADEAKKYGLNCAHPSIVMINNPKGNQMFYNIFDSLKSFDFSDISYINKNYFVPHEGVKGYWGYNDELYKSFADIYSREGFIAALYMIACPNEFDMFKKIISIYTDNKVIILYGTGIVGKTINDILKYFKSKLNVFFAQTQKNDEIIDGVNVLSLDELKSIPDKDNYIVCVSVGEKYRNEIEKNVREAGFTKVVV